MSRNPSPEPERTISEPIGTIIQLYGDVTRQIVASGNLADMLVLQERASNALSLLRTKSGQVRAAEAGISAEHVKDLRAAYRALNRAIAKLEPRSS
jgi:hypothetical protein